MVFLSAKNLAAGTSTLTLAGGGGLLHYKYDLLSFHKSSNDWIHTPEDLNDTVEWNQGYFWHKFTVLKYGRYRSRYLEDVVGNDDQDDKVKTDRLIKYCHDRKYNFNYFSNRLEIKKVKELCYLDNQKNFYSRFVDIWNWEYKNNKRILLIMENINPTNGHFLSFVISHYIFNFNVHSRHSVNKLEILLGYFQKIKEDWEEKYKSTFEKAENTKKVVVFFWKRKPVNRWQIMESTHKKKKDIFENSSIPLLD